jgi:hypothetical protein
VALLPTPEPVATDEWTPQHDAVAAYLAEHPDASQREVARHLWPGSDGGGTRGVNAGALMRAVRNGTVVRGGQKVNENTTHEQHELVEYIRQLHAQGFSQNHIITTVFGIKKGGSKAYYDAREIYRQAIDAIMPGDGDEDEDEADE